MRFFILMLRGAVWLAQEAYTFKVIGSSPIGATILRRSETDTYKSHKSHKLVIASSTLAFATTLIIAI